jgi:hypothetical protein
MFSLSHNGPGGYRLVGYWGGAKLMHGCIAALKHHTTTVGQQSHAPMSLSVAPPTKTGRPRSAPCTIVCHHLLGIFILEYLRQLTGPIGKIPRQTMGRPRRAFEPTEPTTRSADARD